MFIDIEDSMDIPIYPDPCGKKISFCVRGGCIKFSSVENCGKLWKTEENCGKLWETMENCRKLSTPKIPPVPTKDTALVLEEMCFRDHVIDFKDSKGRC